MDGYPAMDRAFIKTIEFYRELRCDRKDAPVPHLHHAVRADARAAGLQQREERVDALHVLELRAQHLVGRWRGSSAQWCALLPGALFTQLPKTDV